MPSPARASAQQAEHHCDAVALLNTFGRSIPAMYPSRHVRTRIGARWSAEMQSDKLLICQELLSPRDRGRVRHLRLQPIRPCARRLLRHTGSCRYNSFVFGLTAAAQGGTTVPLDPPRSPAPDRPPDDAGASPGPRVDRPLSLRLLGPNRQRRHGLRQLLVQLMVALLLLLRTSPKALTCSSCRRFLTSTLFDAWAETCSTF